MTNSEQSTEKNISEQKVKAKTMVAKEGVLPAIKFIQGVLPESAAKFNLLILMESRFNELNRKIASGIISDEDQNLEANKISNDFLTFLDALKEEDFAEKTAEEVAEKPDLRIGKTLYRIPQKMQIGVEVECSVWISFDMETILKEVQQATTDEVRDIRISNVMGVELIPHGSTDAEKTFDILTYDETEQIIEKGLSTNWVFYVKPLKEGKHPLILRISVIELIDGEKLQKTKVLREVVQIIGEAVEVPEDGVKAKEAKGLVVATPKDSGGKGVGAAGGGKAGKTGGMSAMSTIAMAIVGMLLVVSSVFVYKYFNDDNVEDIQDLIEQQEEKKVDKEVMKIPAINLQTITDTTEIIKIIENTVVEKRKKDAIERLTALRDSLSFKKGELNGKIKETEPVEKPESETNPSNNPTNNKPNRSKKKSTKQIDSGSGNPLKTSTPSSTSPETEEPPIVKKKPSIDIVTEIEEPTTSTPPQGDASPSFEEKELKSEYPYHPDCETTEESAKNDCTNTLIDAAIRQALATLEVTKGGGFLSFMITKTGKLRNVRMAQSSSNPEFGQVVRQSISGMPGFAAGRKQLKKEVKIEYDKSGKTWKIEFLK